MAIVTDSPMRSGKRKDKSWDHPDREWEVRAAMHTMMRASEIVADKKLMAQVKKHAAEHAAKMRDVSHQAAMLAKAGRISPRQMAKMGKA